MLDIQASAMSMAKIGPKEDILEYVKANNIMYGMRKLDTCIWVYIENYKGGHLRKMFTSLATCLLVF